MRCFAAVEVASPAVRQALAAACDHLRRVLGGSASQVKWVPSHQFHFTLRFFGELDPAQVEAAAAALQRAAAETPPFSLTVAGLGAFPNPSRPNVIWAGTGAGQARLVALARRLEDALAEAGFEREARPFKPHLTLGRVRQGADLGPLLREHLTRPPETYGTWQVDRIVLMQSVLLPAGPRYSVLAAAALTGAVGG